MGNSRKDIALKKLLLRIQELENFRITSDDFYGHFRLRLPLVTKDWSLDSINKLLSELTPQKLKLSTNPSKYLYYHPFTNSFNPDNLYSISELQEILREQIVTNEWRKEHGLQPIGMPNKTGVATMPIWTKHKERLTPEVIRKYRDPRYVRDQFIKYGNNFITSIERGMRNYIYYNAKGYDVEKVFVMNYLIKKLKTRDKEKLGRFVYLNLQQSDIRVTDYFDSDQDVMELGNEENVFKYLGISKDRVEKDVKRLIELDEKMNSQGLTDKEKIRYDKLVEMYMNQ